MTAAERKVASRLKLHGGSQRLIINHGGFGEKKQAACPLYMNIHVPIPL